MQRNSIEKRLETAAANGQMDIHLFLWKKEIRRLEKNGLVVMTKYPARRKGEYYCNISWAGKREAGENEDFTHANYLHDLAVKAKEQSK